MANNIFITPSEDESKDPNTPLSLKQSSEKKPVLTPLQNSLARSTNLELFDAKTIDTIKWPKTQAGNYAKRFLLPLLKNGIHHYIDNIEAKLLIAKIDDMILPIIISTENYTNSFVCSPYCQYISYGKESLQLIKNPLLRKIIDTTLNALGRFLRFGKINSVVYINNWLFSTDLYPSNLTETHIKTLVLNLKERFPKHAIVLRSLNAITTPILIQSLKQLDFELIASRQIYVTDTRKKELFETRILKSDFRLWENNPYQIVDEMQISQEERKEILRLYQLLYLSKHSYFNPQINDRYLNLLIDEHLLKFKILKRDGSIKGVAGYCIRDNIMVCPFFGYEKEDPEATVIYRLLSTSLLFEAKKKSLLFHQCSGASFYKTIRRAEGCIDFIGVYSHHLSWQQKLVWFMLRVFINTFAPTYMRKY